MEQLPKFTGPPELDPSRRRRVNLAPEGMEQHSVSVAHPMRGTELTLHVGPETVTLISEGKSDYLIRAPESPEDILLQSGDSRIIDPADAELGLGSPDPAPRCYLENVDGRLNVTDAARDTWLEFPSYVSCELRPVSLLKLPGEPERRNELERLLHEFDRADLRGHSDFDRAVHSYKCAILRAALNEGKVRYGAAFEAQYGPVSGRVDLSDEEHGEAFNEAFFMVEDYCVTGGANLHDGLGVTDEYPQTD